MLNPLNVRASGAARGGAAAAARYPAIRSLRWT
eukprot:COSAG02_NODE_29933_length_560_cov_0.800434_1_plen_32_part_10